MAEPACRIRRYAIFNPATDDLKKVYLTAFPALYMSYHVALSVLKAQQKRGRYQEYEVHEVEIVVR